MSASTRPLYIDATGRGLFAALHPADGETRFGVLIVPPLLHEAATGYRLFVLLADALAARGAAVLRFDYHGTGDSAGDDETFTFDGALHDANLALDCLRRQVEGLPVVILGVRAGALIAARIATGEVAALWLWQPVLDGARHVEELAGQDRLAWRAAYGASDPRDGSLMGHPIDSGLPPALAAEKLDPTRGLVERAVVLDAESRLRTSAGAIGIPLPPDLVQWVEDPEITMVRAAPVKIVADRLVATLGGGIAP